MATASVPNSFSAATTIVSAQVNANFTALVNLLNGSIQNDNLGTFSGQILWAITTNVLAANISNSGTEGDISITRTGILASGKASIKVADAANETTGDALISGSLSSASSTIPALLLDHRGTTGSFIKGTQNTSNYAELANDGSWKYVGNRTPGWTSNLGLAAATTTDANDSIKITGSDGTALGATNPAYVCLPSTTAGRLTVFRITADVTIKVTGAHFGLNTLGDFTNAELRVYAINDNGSLKWGVALKGGQRTIVDTSTSATQASVTTKAKTLVNSALSAGTWPCVQVGWVNANFDDTGGAHEDLWAIQTSAGNINIGVPVPDRTDWSTSLTFTPNGFGTLVSSSIMSRRVGDTLEVWGAMEVGTTAASTASISLPTGYVIDTTAVPALSTSFVAQCGEGHGTNGGGGSGVYTLNNGVVLFVDPADTGKVYYATANATDASANVFVKVNANLIADTNGQYNFKFAVPMAHWSAN